LRLPGGFFICRQHRKIAAFGQAAQEFDKKNGGFAS
jgi:hypothetical protein